MAQYDVDIQLAVKNLNTIKSLKKELSAVEEALKRISKLDTFDPSGFRARAKARKDESNQLKEQIRLTNDLRKAESARRAQLLRGVRLERQQRLRGLNQYSGPIGPGPATPVGGRIRQMQEIEQLTKAAFASYNEMAMAAKANDKAITRSELANDDIVFKQKLAKIDALAKAEIAASKQANDAALKDFDQKLQNRVSRRKTSFFGDATGRQRAGAAISAGAFPLLFGGGPAMALGGALGGAVTGKMFGPAAIGLQVLGGALDQFVASSAKTGQAVNSVADALQLARDQSLFSTDAEKERAAVLEEQGRVSELATLLTQQFADKIGNEGLKSLQNLGDETDKTAKLWGTLTLQLQTLIAGPLTEFLKLVNSFLGGITTEQRFKAFQKDIAGDPAALARFKEIEAEVRGGTRKNVRGSKTEFVPGALTIPRQAEIIRRATAEGLRPATNQIVPTAGDLRTMPVPKTRKPGKTDEERALERAEKLNARLVRQAELGRLAVRATVEERKEETRLLELAVDKGQEFADFTQRVRDLVEEGVPFSEAFAIEKAHFDAKELNKEAEKMKELFQQIGTSIKDGVVESISAAVEGTKSLAEVASNMLRRIADQLLDIGVNLALFGVPIGFGKKDSGGLLSSIFGRANGGAVASGRPYMVGERGPELFVPGAQGNIVPNKAMGGANIVVNVDASGTQAQGDQPNAKALGAAIGAAVQAELVRQKRPGGLLSN